MKKKAGIAAAILALILVILNVGLILLPNHNLPTVTFEVDITADVSDDVQVYYADAPDGFSASAMSSAGYEADQTGTEVTLSFTIAPDKDCLRIDPGSAEGTWTIANPRLTYGDVTTPIDIESFTEPVDVIDAEITAVSDDSVTLATHRDDPRLIAAVPVSVSEAAAKAVSDGNTKFLILKILALLLVDGTALIFIIFRKRLLALPKELIQNRALIFKLAKNDFKTKYAGSYLGIFWAFVQPVVTVLVYWFVFSVGFKSGSVSDVPFVVYLVCGIVPWFFIQDFLISGTNAMIEYSYLVKKVVFNISVLPMVKAISAFFVHAFFVVIAILIAMLHGIMPGLYVIQILYYFFAMFVFGLGIVYATCAIVIFFRDLSQIISIILQVGIWTIPIMWNLAIVPSHLQFIFKINPMYYIVTGYRDAIYGHVWAWNHLGGAIYFWIFTLVCFVLGTVIFRRLKVHFADVL